MCDSGSSHSWISQSLANKLQLSGKPQTIALNAFLGTQLLQTECVDLQITGESDSFKIQVLTKDSIDVGRDSINFPALKTKFDHLGVLPDSIFSYANVELVLGQTALFCTRPLEYKISGKLSPVAIRMPLGWTVGGPLPQREFQKASSFLVTSQNADLAELASQWWSLESYGSNKSVDPRSEADAKAETILQQSTYHDGERYVVGMLWAETDLTLPNNYYSALAQLKSLERRLDKDADLKVRYSETIKQDLAKQYIVKVPKGAKSQLDGPEWYLPHHPVVNPHKPEKVRRVLNGAASFQGKSLNKALLIGPDLLQNLVHVILRFRQHRVAVSADVEGMFLQVGVPEADQDVLRFLWREDNESHFP